MDKHTTTKKMLSGFAWEGSTKLVIQTLTWVTTILVARILSPEDYGVVAISSVFIGFLFIMTEMGFMSSLINMKEVEQEDYDSVFWLNMLLGLVLYAILYFSAPVIADFYGSDVLIEIIRFSAVLIPLRGLKVVPVAIAMRNMNFKYQALVEMTGQFVAAGSSVIMAYNGFGVWTLVYSLVLGQAVITCAYLPLMNGVPALNISVDRIKRIVPYGLYLTGSDMLGFFTKNSDVMIIGLFFSEKIVGYYSMGFHLAALPLDKIGALFNRVAFPSISRAKENTAFASNMFVNMHKYLLIIAFPVLMGMAYLAEDIVVLLMTEKWRPAAPIIQAFCVLNLLRISGMMMPFVLSGLGYAKKNFMYNFASSIVLPLSFLVGVQFGLNGVLASWFVAYPVLYLFMLSILLPKLGLSIGRFIETFRVSAVCTVVMIAMMLLTESSIDTGSNVSDLIASVLSGMLFYFIAYYIFFKHELLEMKDKISAIRSGKAVEEKEV